MPYNIGAERYIAQDKKPPKGDSPIRRMKRNGMSVTLYDTALTQAAYGRPVSHITSIPVKVIHEKTNGKRIPVALYDTALTMQAYGNGHQLGDLFNDIMGTVVPGWDQRPEWMKKIQVKPDPAKIIQSAAKVVPPEQVGKVLDTAQAAGVNVFYQTPAGNVPITSGMVQGLYSGLPIIAQAKSAIENVPWYVWVGGGALVLVLLARR